MSAELATGIEEPSRPIRRVQLADLLVLIAGVAVAIALGTPRALWLLAHHANGWLRGVGVVAPLDRNWWQMVHSTLFAPSGWADSLVSDLFNLGLSTLLPASVTLLLLRLIRPRPARVDLLRQPGFWASSSAVVGLLLIPAGWWYFLVEVPFLLVPSLVAASWAILAVSGRWRAERSWLDRAGRTLGWAWLALVPVELWLDRL